MTFEEFYASLTEKREASPETSNSANYLQLGPHAIGKKLVEEAAESWMAANFEGPSRTAEEIAQLIYWAALLAISMDLKIDDILKEL